MRFFLLFSLLPLLLTGCWDLQEIDRRAFATTIGIDRAEHGAVEMTVQVPLPQRMLPPGTSAAKEGKIFNTASATGVTVNAAINTLQTKVYRDLVFQQNKAVIFSGEIARRGLKPHLDYLLRAPRATPQSLVFITRGKSAKEILEFSPETETLPGLQFIQSAQAVTKSNYTYYLPIWMFGQKLVDEGWDPYAPLIDVDQKEETFITAGLAVFNGDRMAGELDQKETQLFGIVTSQMRAGNLLVDLPEGGRLTLRNVRARTQIQARHADGVAAFKVRVCLSATLSELTDLHIGLTPAYNRHLEQATAVWLKPRVEGILRKLQRLNADVVGFGAVLRAQRQDLWRRIDWKKIYPKARFTVAVEVRIVQNGMFR